MNSRLTMAVLAVCLGAAPAATRAGEASHVEGKAEKLGEKIDEKIETMKKNLTLTPEQETKLRTILREKAENIKKFSEEANQKIRAALTPDQRTKYDKMKADN